MDFRNKRPKSNGNEPQRHGNNYNQNRGRGRSNRGGRHNSYGPGSNNLFKDNMLDDPWLSLTRNMVNKGILNSSFLSCNFSPIRTEMYNTVVDNSHVINFDNSLTTINQNYTTQDVTDVIDNTVDISVHQQQQQQQQQYDNQNNINNENEYSLPS